MIISASRRTDIPAFYTPWFMKCVDKGSFMRVNPYNPKQRSLVSLKPDDVDAVVFWTRNPYPLIPHLKALTELRYNYYFQYTLNDYPREFEPGMPVLEQKIATFKQLSELVGPKRVVWRFDPLILSSITPTGYLADRFDALAYKLNGFTTRVVISFLDIYGKVKPRLEKLEKETGVVVQDLCHPTHTAELMDLAQSVAQSAAANNMEIFTCGESIDLTNVGIKPGACIDAELIEELFGLKLNVRKDKSQRSACLCAKAVDMGFYDTCLYGCTYCYAYTSKRAIENAVKRYGLEA
ncbi:MAG: DUF1848 domain-containing protein [Firmicutes bacterium]|nr:DUF1848 domain-containing protein [Bacillota bacterium]